MPVVEVGLVFVALVAVGAMYTALRALENADAKVREIRIRSGVNQLAADFAILADDVQSLQASVKKLRNRENARHARAAKSAQSEEMSDDEWLQQTNLKLALGGKPNGQ